MADKNLKNSENVPGRYYVDNTCIDCGLCPDTAPQFFKRFDEGGYTIVYRQPQTPDEVQLAEEAVSGCPTESIGNDGDEAQSESAPHQPPNANSAEAVRR